MAKNSFMFQNVIQVKLGSSHYVPTSSTFFKRIKYLPNFTELTQSINIQKVVTNFNYELIILYMQILYTNFNINNKFSILYTNNFQIAFD